MNLQHARPLCPSPTPGVHPNSCPPSRQCHPAISSCVIPFSSCPQSLPASGSSPVSQLFAWGGQSFGVSASASVLLMNTQDWFPLGWTGWISLQSKGLSRVFSNTSGIIDFCLHVVLTHICKFKDSQKCSNSEFLSAGEISQNLPVLPIVINLFLSPQCKIYTCFPVQWIIRCWVPHFYKSLHELCPYFGIDSSKNISKTRPFRSSLIFD